MKMIKKVTNAVTSKEAGSIYGNTATLIVLNIN